MTTISTIPLLGLVQSFADPVNAARGASLLGYLPPWVGATGTSVADALDERVSAKRFGLRTTNTGAQNNAAMDAAIAYAIAEGGLTIHIPRGTYNFATSINFSGANGTRITGDGIDATKLQINHATADFLVCGSSSYQTIDNLTLTSSVTRTAGAMVTGGYWTRGLIERVKITNHFNGIHLTTFEECYVFKCSIVTPTGLGAAIIAGTQAAVNQGANLHIVSCFIRGNDESNFLNPCIGQYGIVIYDVGAIYCIDTDIACITDQCLLVNPLTVTSDLFFLQTYFDGTQSGDNVLLRGTGLKRRIQFTGCWFSFAGRLGPGLSTTPDRMGLNLANEGNYENIFVSGGKFLAQTGAGIFVGHINADLAIVGAVIDNVGVDTATYKCGIYVEHNVSQGKFMLINGVKFISAPGNTFDIIFATANSHDNVITGCMMPKGISYPSGANFGGCSGNSDGTTDNIASGSNLHPSPNKNFYTVTGTTNINTMDRTYPGHIMMLVFQGALTVAHSSSIKLTGGANLITVTGTTLTLMCEPAGGGGWREIARHN